MSTKKHIAGLLICMVSILLTGQAFAQDITQTHWIFGNSSSYFTFDKNGRAPILRSGQATSFGTNGSTVITDKQKGNLLFYSDGTSIYDASHKRVPGMSGKSLNANPNAIQPVVSAPFTDGSGRYYIFSKGNSGISYTVVNPTLLGNSTTANFPLGDVEVINTPLVWSGKPGELFKILPGDVPETFWLMAQDTVSMEIRLTEVSAGGIGTTSSFDIFGDDVLPFAISNVAVKMANSTSYTIAFSSESKNDNIILVNYDPGRARPLLYSEQYRNTALTATAPSTYDLEWSANGSKLYFSQTGDEVFKGRVYQVDLTDTTNQFLRVRQVSDYFYRSYGLQRGIDGNVYHLYQATEISPIQLGAINFADSTLESGLTYQENVLDASFAGTQFPAFAPYYLPGDYFTMDIETFDLCEGGKTKFVAKVSPTPHTYFWDFGDGSFATGPAPIHAYEGSGGQLVELTVSLNDYFQSLSVPLDIFSASTVDLGMDTTICAPLILDPGVSGTAYIWNTGETTKTIEVDSSGAYWVDVSFANGCTRSDLINVTYYDEERPTKYNRWYLGDQAGIDWENASPTPLPDGNLMDAPEGCATISDVDGRPMFYTNGSTVWNMDHEVMSNGSNIGGDSTAVQSAIAVPFPNDSTMYYIFTTQEVFGGGTYQLKMSMVDMKKDVGRGEVISKNNVIMDCSTERMTISELSGTPWLLTHEFGNDVFRSYLIGEDGVLPAVYSVAGEVHGYSEEKATGQMRFRPDLSGIGVLIPGGSNRLELLDFDSVGVVSNDRIVNIGENSGLAYGLEFAQPQNPEDSSNRVYVTISGANSKLLQFDLNSSDIASSKFEIGTGSGYGALQSGPDNQIYLAIEGSSNLGTISNPSAKGLAAGFDEAGQSLAGRISRLGLPLVQRLQYSNQEPMMQIAQVCVGLETSFSAIGRDPNNSIEEYFWDFGDGSAIVNAQDTSHVYSSPGEYIVQLRLSNPCDLDSVLTDTVQVFDRPEPPTIPSDTILCGDIVALSAWDVADSTLTYYWSTGDSTREVIFNQPIIVDAVIINAEGCPSDTATTFIGKDEVFLDLGPDRLVCLDNTITLNSNRAGLYDWKIDDNRISSDSSLMFEATEAGDFNISLSVFDDIKGCTYRDSLTIKVQPDVTFNTTATINPSCEGTTGELNIELPNEGNYSIDVGIINLSDSVIRGPGEIPVGPIEAGLYPILLTNNTTGCSRVRDIFIEDVAEFNVEATGISECIRTGDLLVKLSDRVPAEINLQITDDNGNVILNSLETLTSRELRFSDLEIGTYTVLVADASPPYCIQIDTATLIVADECFYQIFAPNAFSPNGNGQNEEWQAFPNEFVEQFEVYVYNRWGDLVYYSRDKDYRWDGTFAGQQVLQDIYTYRMVFTTTNDADGQIREQYGTVTVIK